LIDFGDGTFYEKSTLEKKWRGYFFSSFKYELKNQSEFQVPKWIFIFNLYGNKLQKYKSIMATDQSNDP